jgi:hypothetical protein
MPALLSLLAPVDVSLAYPALATPRFTVAEAAPAVGPFQGGIVTDVTFYEINSVGLGVSAGLHGWGAGWDRVADFGARVWRAELDYTLRFAPGDRARLVRAWYGLGSGLRLGLLDVDRWSDVGSWGLGAWTGAGLEVGKGPVRAVGSVRAGFTADLSTWSGTVVASGETTTWSYWPGSAQVTVLAGVGFR